MPDLPARRSTRREGPMVRLKTTAIFSRWVTGSKAHFVRETNGWGLENDHRDVLRPLLGKSQRSSTGNSNFRRGGIDPSMTIELRQYHRIRGCGAMSQWEDPRHRGI